MAITRNANTYIISSIAKASGTVCPLNAPSVGGTGRVFGIAIFASDNVSGTDGFTNLHSSMTDSVPASGNVYTKVYEYTNGQGSAAAGVTLSVWIVEMPNGYSTNTNGMQLNLSNAVVAKAGFMSLYTVDVGNTIQPVSGALTGGPYDNVTLPSLSLSGLTNKEYIFHRINAVERDGVTYTRDTANGWLWWNTNLIFGQTTTGGAAVSNVGVSNESKVVTTTGAIDNMTSDIAADMVSILIAFEEVTPANFTPIDPMGMSGFFGL